MRNCKRHLNEIRHNLYAKIGWPGLSLSVKGQIEPQFDLRARAEVLAVRVRVCACVCIALPNSLKVCAFAPAKCVGLK